MRNVRACDRAFLLLDPQQGSELYVNCGNLVLLSSKLTVRQIIEGNHSSKNYSKTEMDCKYHKQGGKSASYKSNYTTKQQLKCIYRTVISTVISTNNTQFSIILLVTCLLPKRFFRVLYKYAFVVFPR